MHPGPGTNSKNPGKLVLAYGRGSIVAVTITCEV